MGRSVLVTVLVLVGAAGHARLQQRSARIENSRPPAVRIRASAEEVTRRFFQWRERQRAAGQPISGNLFVLSPAIYVYNAAGQCLQKRERSSETIPFLQALRSQAASDLLKGPAGACQAPPLSELVAIFDQLQPYRKDLLEGGHPVLVVWSCTERSSCREQDRAVARQRRRLQQLGVGLVEIVLHR
jgi:hypothetical protein